MKKYFAMMVAVLFLFGVVGMSFAQQAAPSGKQDTPAAPIDGKKSDASKKAQAVTPEKKAAAGTPGVATGDAKPAGDIKGKKTDKSKKRQAQTPDKKKAAEAPATGEGMAAPPAPAKK
jgi:hypothetical protein